MNIDKVKSLIPKYTAGYLATSVNNVPDIRGWQYLYEEEGKFYFTTSKSKQVYKDLKENPNAAFICEASEYTFRIIGKVDFVEEKKILKKVFENLNPEVASIYGDIDSNGFSAFTISNGEIKYAKGYDPFISIKF